MSNLRGACAHHDLGERDRKMLYRRDSVAKNMFVVHGFTRRRVYNIYMRATTVYPKLAFIPVRT